MTKGREWSRQASLKMRHLTIGRSGKSHLCINPSDYFKTRETAGAKVLR